MPLPAAQQTCGKARRRNQQESSRLITQDHGADYIFGLKGNQSGILERAQCKLSPVFFPGE